MTTSGARTIADELEAAGALSDVDQQALNFDLQRLGGHNRRSNLWFEPILPDGSTVCTVCG